LKKSSGRPSSFLVIIITLVSTTFYLVVAVPFSFAIDCSRPPTGFGGSWARAYASWCQQCGGRYNSSNQSCIPGPNWGGGTSGGSSYDYEAERQRQEEERRRQLEAERQRQRELEEERKRQEEETRRRHEDFERKKQEALRSMKSIAEGELGLKGIESGSLGLKDIGDSGIDGLGLKDISSPVAGNKELKDTMPAKTARPPKPDCEWGNMGPSVVDLRCLGLDPDKPIAVDPHIARGQERVFPVQIDPKTFENVNYKKGFQALMRFDVASAAAAVQYFRQAQKERPKDPMVRNGLLLAQDIHKARKTKMKDDNARALEGIDADAAAKAAYERMIADKQARDANYFTLQSYAALMMGDNQKAKEYVAQARKLGPDNNMTKFIGSLAEVDLGPAGAYPKRKDAYKLVANSLISITKYDFAVAEAMLELAHELQPEDKFIGIFLQELHNYGTGLISSDTKK